jgi:hypothetical protein
MPLPYYILSSEISGDEALRQSVTAYIPIYRGLSPVAEKALADILPRTTPLPRAAAVPVLLDIDKTPGMDREDYTLRTILTGSFQGENWAEAEKLLSYFMAMHINDDIRERAHFYQGQVLFFQQKYAESFMEFLLPLDSYYAEVTPWISAVLENLKLTAGTTEG